jgi:uncharacterized protein (DUF3820 family)
MHRKQLNDVDLFPFGEHKGKPMMSVPASYLDWLRCQPWLKQWPAIAEYIGRSARAIEWELKAEGRKVGGTQAAPRSEHFANIQKRENGERLAACRVPRKAPERTTNLSSHATMGRRRLGDKSAWTVRVPPGFHRLRGKELVWHGDYVADERFGLQLWDGQGGFQADSFAVRVYRKKDPEAFDHNSTNKPKRKGKHR